MQLHNRLEQKRRKIYKYFPSFFINNYKNVIKGLYEMVSFKEYCNKKIDEADLGFVEPGLDKGDQGIPYKFKRNNQYIVVEDKNYKLTSKDKKDLKELFEVWDYLKNNIGNELRNFEENNIYRNDVAQFRMEKVRKLLPILNQMKLDWLSKYVKG